MSELELKVQKLKEKILDKENPIRIDELLLQVAHLYDEEEVTKSLTEIMKDYSKLWYCAKQFFEISEHVIDSYNQLK